MLPEWVAVLPTWLVVGVALGLVASVGVAAVFVVGDRLFPTAPTDRSRVVDGTTRRRDEIRTYLDAIGERYVEEADVHGFRVAFYLPDRTVAITFDAKAYFGIERAGTAAVLCEHEMPGAHLGRRLPFEVPALDRPVPIDDPVRAAYDLLDLSADATLAEVRTAYRSKVLEVHPDRGGDPDTFQRVREAYTTVKAHAE